MLMHYQESLPFTILKQTCPRPERYQHAPQTQEEYRTRFYFIHTSSSSSSSRADDSTLREYDTIIVNAGAHRRRGGMEAYGQMMRQASRFLSASMERLHGDKAILIVRNTVPGHGRSFDR